MAIARALAAELQALEHAVEITVAPVRDRQTYGTLHPPIIMMPVLDAYISKIGLLSHDKVKYVARVYFTIKELTWKIDHFSTELPGSEYRRVDKDGLGSGNRNQKMTVAAMQIALMKVWAHRS